MARARDARRAAGAARSGAALLADREAGCRELEQAVHARRATQSQPPRTFVVSPLQLWAIGALVAAAFILLLVAIVRVFI